MVDHVTVVRAVDEACETGDLYTPLKVGDKYSSYEELEQAVKALEKVQNINFWKRDSRSIEAAKRRVDICISPALKYYEVKYACIKGGRSFQSTSAGARPNQRSASCVPQPVKDIITLNVCRTFKDDCNAFVNVRASKDGQRLVVIKLNLEHNHPTNKVIMKFHSLLMPLHFYVHRSCLLICLSKDVLTAKKSTKLPPFCKIDLIKNCYRITFLHQLESTLPCVT